ncbi:hypothetical protein CsatB_017073 [Cannabis sativa]|uniref:uncharacterized protein LOC115710740 n=1 Tax=Cannabis sativa TaxID=3483 RepID=UPI0029CA951A|nr:uncharacterized protein LOC115710740 [Cannabis sativa]
MLNVHKAGLVGLLETRVKAQKLGALYVNMLKGWCFTSNIAWHEGGRIIVAWNPFSYSVNILNCTSQLIHLLVATLDGKHRFYVTFVYAFNKLKGRKMLWSDLKNIATHEPWMVMGDFNEILFKEERMGEMVKYNAANDFIDCVGICQLKDIKFGGSYYTWNNKRQGSDRICSKIDRVLANQKWLDNFPNAEAIFSAEGLFDHTPTIVSMYHEILSGKKPFNYFRMWTSHSRYAEIVKGVWQQIISGSKMYQVISKLKKLKVAFKELNKKDFLNIQEVTEKAREELKDLQKKLQTEPLNHELIDKEVAARHKYGHLLKGLTSFLQ